MKLNLTKPLIVFDLETTGLDMIKDRIIQISYIKVMPDGTEDRKNLFVNPCKEIPAEVVALTGISNEDVKDAPTFKQLAATLEKELQVAMSQATIPTTSMYRCSQKNSCVLESTSISTSAVSSMRRPSS